MKPLFLFVFVIFSVITCAQTDTSYSLLWYKGKKINDTVLLTPSGRRVTYSPSTGSASVNIPDAKNPLTPIIQAIKKNEQRRLKISELITRLPSARSYLPMAPTINRVFERVEKRTNQLLENKINLIDENTRPEITSPSLTESWKDLPTWVEEDYKQVLNYFVKYYNNTEVPFPPPPPDTDFDYCYPCDSARQRAYRKASQEFMKAYLQEETDNLKKTNDILHYFSYRRAKKLPYDTASAKTIEQNLLEGLPNILQRIEIKMNAVWLGYRDDVKKLPFLMYEMLLSVRSNQLFGKEPGKYFPELDSIAVHVFNTTIKYIKEVSKLRDYRVILNLDWIVDLFRTIEMMSLTSKVKMENVVTDFIANVSFKVSVDADATLANEEAVFRAQMVGDNTFTAVADADCRLRWNLLGPDPKKMIFRLETAKMKLQAADPAYIGTRTWMASPATFRLDFCNEENRDSAMFYHFFPRDGEEKWDLKDLQNYPTLAVRSIFFMSFLDKKRMDELVNDPQIMEEVEKKMTEKLKELETLQQKMKNPSALTPEELEEMNNFIKAGQDFMYELPVFHFLVRGTVINFKKLVFDHKLDGKALFPDNPDVEHALFKVKIEHVEGSIE